MKVFLFPVFTLIVSYSSLSQTTTYDDCWECILAAELKDDARVIETCSKYIEVHPESKSVVVANYLLGATYLKTGKLEKGKKLLSDLQTKNGILSAFAGILVGDAYSDLGQIEEAIRSYEAAAKIDINKLTTPLALYKAMVNALSRGDHEKVQGYVLTLKNRFKSYYSSNNIEKYYDKTAVHKAFDLPEQATYEQPEEYGYGTLYGKRVNIERFLEEVAAAYAYQYEYEERDDTYDMHKITELFDGHVQKLLQNKECGELGLRISDAEFEAYLFGEKGFEVMPDLKYGFTNEETGEFDKRLLKARIDELSSSEERHGREMWKASQMYYTTRRLHEKLASIYAHGSYVTNVEAQQAMKEKSEVKHISYIRFPYYTEAGDTIKVSKEELEAYYQENKDDTRYLDNRDMHKITHLHFYTFPSKEDSLAIEKKLMELKKEFKSTKEDSLFVMRHSDMKGYSSTHLATFKPDDDEKARQGMTYPATLKGEFKKAKVGDVVGPYIDGKNYRIAKVLDFNENSLTARHLLIAASRSDQKAVFEAKLQTEKLMKEINHDNFAALVAKYSEDPGSKHKGGVYTDFFDYEMVPEFSKFAVEEEIGKIGYVQTDFGFHIMEVLERKRVDLPVLAIISKEIKSSATTVKTAQDKVAQMTAQLKERISQEPISNLNHVVKEVADAHNTFPFPISFLDNSPMIYGFDSTNSIALLRFAYDKEVKPGDIMSKPLVQDDRIIIPVFIGAFKKGVLPFSELEIAMERDLIEEKKARLLSERINTSLGLPQIAKAADMEIVDAEIRLSENGLGEKGYEPEMIGALFRESKLNQLIVYQGKSGVYALKVNSSSFDEGLSSKREMKNLLIKNREEYLSSSYINALIQKAEVINNSILFHFRIRK